MANVLLVNPHTPDFVRHRDRCIPLGLLYLASFLRKAGHSVRLVDVNNDVLSAEAVGGDRSVYFNETLWERVGSFVPDFVGIGCLFSGRFVPALFLCKHFRLRFPKAKTVLGGLHPTIFAAEITRKCSEVDFVVVGEGEVAFAELASGKNPKEVAGLAFSGQVNPRGKFVEDLDSLPFPAYDLINLRDYFFDTSGWHNPKGLPIDFPLPIITSRGCPNRCTFCSMHLVQGRGYRVRSAGNVVDEIEWLYKEFNHRYFSFMDDNFTLSKSRTVEICNEIKLRKLDIQFDTPNGVSIKTLDKEVLSALVSSGLVRTCVAIESGSDFIRNKVMKKGLSRQKIVEFFEAVKEFKQLWVKAFFMVGFPEETRKTLADTLAMIEWIPVNQISIFFVVPFPHTELFAQCEREGLLNIPSEGLYCSERFSNYNDSDFPFIKPYALSLNELVAFREKAYKAFKERGKK